MRRQDKYPNTDTFMNYNANPKGKYTSDCVIRAISTATGYNWAKVLYELTDIAVRTGYMVNEPKCYAKYLEENGWIKHKQPRKADGTKYTGEEFCRKIGRGHDVAIAHIGGHHVVCIFEGRVHDTWDSTDGCIGNYWTKSKWDAI